TFHCALPDFAPGPRVRLIPGNASCCARGDPRRAPTRNDPTTMKRIHSAILLAQGLSYALIVTFILADRQYNFSGILRDADQPMSPHTAYAASCLVTLVGATNI